MIDTVLLEEDVLPRLSREMAGYVHTDLGFRARGFLDDEEPHPSKVIQDRSEPDHRVGELYRSMPEQDAKLEGLICKRIDAVLALPLQISPGDQSQRAKEAADLCANRFLDIHGFANINLRHQLEAEFDGIAVEEVIWGELTRGPFAGAVVPVDLKDRPMWRFGFRRGDDRLRVRRPNGKRWVLPPTGKFLVTRFGSKDSPWGKAAKDALYWPWYLKKQGWGFWADFVRKFVSPALAVTYKLPQSGPGSDEKKQHAKALNLARSIRGGKAAAMPEDLAAAFLEAAHAGNSGFQQFIQMLDRSMSLLALGEVNTSGDRPGVGAFASDKVSDGIRAEKIKLVAMLAAQICRPLVRWTTDVNFGPDVATPCVGCAIEDASDIEERKDGVERALAAGVDVPLRQARRAWQVEEPRNGEPVVPARAAGLTAEVEDDE